MLKSTKDRRGNSLLDLAGLGFGDQQLIALLLGGCCFVGFRSYAALQSNVGAI